ncbi:probable inactive peptidyl-prolyl cis-trans isomerase-like 6 isoform X2 [Pseudophryne corroboree]|uniref:probable inactive peptidyl-prolyl cis-trans isomerase-like 6 isoform X2 n=1 Tax=Pseudophryne corroboree TaxID=495146 RepID=UPI0030813E21
MCAQNAAVTALRCHGDGGTPERAVMASDRLQLEVVGLLSEPPFHIAKCTAEVLKHTFGAEFEDPALKPLLEFSWSEYIYEKKKHVFVYIDIAILDKPIGRLLFEIYSDLYPKTCKNFQLLCTGEAGNSASGVKLHYKGSPFHRIVKNGWIQGGDILSGKGNEGESVFGDTFEDENFAFSHNKRGILGMANKGRHSNGSQFYITLQATPYMDRKLVAFGQLVEGSEVLQKMEDIPTYNERPKLDCTVVDCGLFTP